MLKVRLQRTGKRGQAYFRVVVLEHTKKPKGKFLELLGFYDPHKKELKVDMEKVNGWVSKGAQVSPTVNNLLVNYKYWDKPKVQSWKPKPQKHGKDTTEIQKGKEAQKEITDTTETPVPEQGTVRGTAQKNQENAEEEKVKTETATVEEPKQAASSDEASLSPRLSESEAGASEEREEAPASPASSVEPQPSTQ